MSELGGAGQVVDKAVKVYEDKGESYSVVQQVTPKLRQVRLEDLLTIPILSSPFSRASALLEAYRGLVPPNLQPQAYKGCSSAV